MPENKAKSRVRMWTLPGTRAFQSWGNIDPTSLRATPLVVCTGAAGPFPLPVQMLGRRGSWKQQVSQLGLCPHPTVPTLPGNPSVLTWEGNLLDSWREERLTMAESCGGDSLRPMATPRPLSGNRDECQCPAHFFLFIQFKTPACVTHSQVSRPNSSNAV